MAALGELGACGVQCGLALGADAGAAPPVAPTHEQRNAVQSGELCGCAERCRRLPSLRSPSSASSLCRSGNSEAEALGATTRLQGGAGGTRCTSQQLTFVSSRSVFFGDRHADKQQQASMVSEHNRAEAEQRQRQQRTNRQHTRSPRSLVDSLYSSSRAACVTCVMSSLQQRRRPTTQQLLFLSSTLAPLPHRPPLHRQSPRPLSRRPRPSLTPRSITRHHPLDERNHCSLLHQARRHPRALLLLLSPVLRRHLPLPLLPFPCHPPSLHERAKLSFAVISRSC